ncbi:MAG: rhodanese-like domain-containing protein [Allosphingosinicella sp.]|uniref:rhodanese-like domain-containing protein n=1 Tax=Allosphingosinicella sp. TaxID=2823234 RepID=UPI003939A9CB
MQLSLILALAALDPAASVLPAPPPPAAASEAEMPRIGVEEARRLIAEEGALLLDVREAQELAEQGKLRGAVHVPRARVAERADPAHPDFLPEFRTDRPIVVYCGTGRRAAMAGAVLLGLGYQRLYNLGGFREAAAAGFETEAN